MIVSTTGSSIESYLEWIKTELSKRSFGEVSISFSVKNGKVVEVKKSFMDSDRISST